MDEYRGYPPKYKYKMTSRSARDKFKIGDKVWLSVEGMEHFWVDPHGFNRWRGLVVGFCKKTHLVRIIKDGQKSSSSYHKDFWTKM